MNEDKITLDDVITSEDVNSKRDINLLSGDLVAMANMNTNYRHVIFTGVFQVVLMSLNMGEEIGSEVHSDTDQFFTITRGSAKVTIDGAEHELNSGESIVVPAGANHNVLNSGIDSLKLYTIYAPAEHPAGTIQKTKPLNK